MGTPSCLCPLSEPWHTNLEHQALDLSAPKAPHGQRRCCPSSHTHHPFETEITPLHSRNRRAPCKEGQTEFQQVLSKPQFPQLTQEEAWSQKSPPPPTLLHQHPGWSGRLDPTSIIFNKLLPRAQFHDPDLFPSSNFLPDSGPSKAGGGSLRPLMPAPRSSPGPLGVGEQGKVAHSSSVPATEEGELLSSPGSTDLVPAGHCSLQIAFSQI